MENKHKKKKYGTGVLAVSLVVGLSIGFCAGFFIGGHVSSGSSTAAESEMIQSEESMQIAENEQTDSMEDTDAGQTAGETEDVPIGGFAVDDEPVLTINDTTIYLTELNARAYMARDQYVSQYGEEPWNQEIEDGITVSEYAKNAMLDEMERVTILCGKADSYGVEPLTEEEESECASRADDYMASLDSNVAEQFSVERDAMLRIYKKEALSMKVYNKILEELTASLRAEDDYKDMGDSEFEKVLMEKFDDQYGVWKDECKIETTETWNEMVVGAVG